MCHRINGMFPEPKDQEEDDFLTQYMHSLQGSVFLWLGMTEKDEVWRWESDGSRVSWLEWFPQSSGNCAFKFYGDKWHRIRCDHNQYGDPMFVCEKGELNLDIWVYYWRVNVVN